MHLESLGIEPRDILPQGNRVDEAQAGVQGGAATVVEIRLGHGRRVVLHHTVLHDLDRGATEATDCRLRTPVDKLGNLLRAPLAIPPEGTDDARFQVTCGSSLDIDG